MAKGSISGTSLTINDEFNLSTSKISMKSKGGGPLPDISDEPVILPLQLAPFIPELLGSLPVISNPGSFLLSPIERSALGAIAAAGRIAISPVTSGFNLAYLPSLLNVTDGSYQKTGLLNAQDLMKLILTLMSKILGAAGPARGFYSQLLKQAMEAAVLAAALKGIQPNCRTGGDPVNFNTGNFLFEKEDLEIKGSIPLHFTRFYNRMDVREGGMGLGWRHNYEIMLLEEDYSYTIIWQDGREEVYRKTEGNVLESLFGNPCRLECSKEGFLYKTKDNLIYTFDRNGKLQNQKDLNGIRLKFYYDKQGRLSHVSSCSGSLHYRYESSNGYLVEVSDHTGRKVGLDYELGRLKHVTNANGEASTYIYDDKRSIQKIKNSREICVLENSYDSQGRTTSQAFADGSKFIYDYQENLNRTLVTDQNGNKVAYIHDEKYQNIKIVYGDGEESFQYNEQNQLISKTDKKGNKTRFFYDDKGNTSQIIYADGEKHNMTYDINNRLLVLSVNGVTKLRKSYDTKGNLIRITDSLGRTRTIVYDENGRAVTRTQPDGSMDSFIYDAHGNIKQITNGSGACIIYEYDDCNRVVRATDGNGNCTRFSYDENNRITGVLNAAKCRCSYEYTQNGKLKKIVDFNGAVISYEYNCMNQVKSVTLPDGGRVSMKYDYMQNIKKKILPNGGELNYTYNHQNLLEQLTLPTGGAFSYEYDPNGNQIAVVEPNGHRTIMKYDERDRLLEITDPSGAKTKYEYDLEGHLISVTNDLGKSHTYYYDEVGQLIKETDTMNHTTCYEYNNMGKVTCVIDPMDKRTTYEYVPGGNISKVVYPDGSYESYDYDKNGNLIFQQNHKGDYLEFSYDCLNQLKNVRSSFGQEKGYTYDKAGRISSITDALGYVTHYEYTAGGKLTSVIDAEDNRTEYAYDSMSNLILICQHEGKMRFLNENGQLSVTAPEDENKIHITRYERDLLGKVESITDPLGMQEHYTYDTMGRLILKKDKQGYETNYSYNSVGDIERVAYTDGRSVAFSYDSLRQLTEIQDWLGTTKMELNEQGRVKKMINYKGEEISYQWGKMGEQETLIYPDGKRISCEYDEWSRLTRLTDGEKSIQYCYDKDGHLNKKIYPDGVVSSYQYNPMGLISSLIHQKDGKSLEMYEYEYDLMGNKTGIWKKRMVDQALPGNPNESQIKEECGFYQYRYDGMNRLTEVRLNREKVNHYEYDAFGNRIWEHGRIKDIHYQYNVANQLVSEDGVLPGKSYEYDARGNLITVYQGTTVVNQYAYDATNRLIKAVNNKGRTARYQYDGLGNRVARQEYGERPKKLKDTGFSEDVFVSEPDKEEDYLLDLTRQYNNLLKKTERVGEEISAQNYIWDTNVVFMSEGHQSYIYLQDERGSAVRLIDIQDNMQTIYGYDEFGRDLYGTQSERQPFGYIGYQKDHIANTYYGQAREYMPETGRFGAEDILKGNLGLPLSMNRYSYGFNNPITYKDLNGKEMLVVSGGNAGYESHFLFIETGINSIKTLKSQYPEEDIAWVIADSGYSNLDKSRFKTTASCYGVNTVFIENPEDLNRYINTKGISEGERSKDKISRMEVFAHGTPGVLLLGYKNNTNANYDIKDIEGVNSNSFSEGMYTWFGSCNTGTEKEGTSFAQEWANATNGTVRAVVDGQTTYTHINVTDVKNWAWAEKKLRGLQRTLNSYSADGSYNYPEASEGVEWKNFYANCSE